MPYQHFGDRDLVAYLCIYGSMHRDPEDGLLYVTKQVVVDKENNIIITVKKLVGFYIMTR